MKYSYYSVNKKMCYVKFLPFKLILILINAEQIKEKHIFSYILFQPTCTEHSESGVKDVATSRLYPE